MEPIGTPEGNGANASLGGCWGTLALLWGWLMALVPSQGAQTYRNSRYSCRRELIPPTGRVQELIHQIFGWVPLWATYPTYPGAKWGWGGVRSSSRPLCSHGFALSPFLLYSS